VSYINPNILQEDWDALGDWVDEDGYGGVSSISPAGQLYFDCRVVDEEGYAARSKEVTIGTGDYYIEIRFKGDVWDNYTNSALVTEVRAETNRIWLSIGNGMDAGDGIIIFDGVNYNRVYSHTWDNNWHTIVFYVHNSQTDVDIWIDKDPVTEEADVTDADCSSATLGEESVKELGYGTENRKGEYHIDYLYIGSDLKETYTSPLPAFRRS